MGKLTNTQRAAIYQAWKDGTQPKELAKQYSVSDQTIYNLINELNRSGSEQTKGKPEPHTKINKEFDDAVNAMIAESKSEDVKPDKLPGVVYRALEQHLDYLQDQIYARKDRIADIETEIEEFQKDIDRLTEWKEQHT